MIQVFKKLYKTHKSHFNEVVLSLEFNFIKGEIYVSLAKYSLKFIHDFHHAQKTVIERNLASISSKVKNLEAVVQKFVEFARVSF